MRLFLPGVLMLCLLFLASLSIVTYASQWYEIKEDSTGWTTGYRSTMNATMTLDGFSVGRGSYSRYTEIDVNHVAMKERISTTNGTIDTKEAIYMHSLLPAEEGIYGGRYIDPNWNSTLIKVPGTQTWILTVQEHWPVTLNAARSIDYLGKGISDRESFGNNLDYAAATHLYATDLRNDRSCRMSLETAWFQLQMNDTTKTIIADLFQPNKTIDYGIISHSNGISTLRYREFSDRRVVADGLETYTGTFDIDRHIKMGTNGRNLTDFAEEREGLPWLLCCNKTDETIASRPLNCASGGSEC